MFLYAHHFRLQLLRQTNHLFFQWVFVTIRENGKEKLSPLESIKKKKKKSFCTENVEHNKRIRIFEWWLPGLPPVAWSNFFVLFIYLFFNFSSILQPDPSLIIPGSYQSTVNGQLHILDENGSPTFSESGRITSHVAARGDSAWSKKQTLSVWTSQHIEDVLF